MKVTPITMLTFTEYVGTFELNFCQLMFSSNLLLNIECKIQTSITFIHWPIWVKYKNGEAVKYLHHLVAVIPSTVHQALPTLTRWTDYLFTLKQSEE